MTAAQDGASEWEKTWGKVIKDPEDFSSWETLVKLAEGVAGGPTRDSPDQDRANLKTVYDHFLSKFPLCFGYWKKYADWELAFYGAPQAKEVFERAVASIYNSVELWGFYCSFHSEKFPESVDETRGLFERGIAAVGYDFLSHPLWDKYIAFEETHGTPVGVIAILERVIRIPLHQYARYFEKYTQLTAGVSPKLLVTPEEYQALEQTVKTEHPEMSPEDVTAQIETQVTALKASIFSMVRDAVQKRWVYESAIKRTYFHIMPLDEAQKNNWKKYLDFEEAEGDIVRIYALYERCMVPCALYEEFWYRYAMYLQSKGDSERAANVFARAATLFVPSSRSMIRLAYASFLESRGEIDQARGIYTSFLEGHAGHMEVVYKYALFELRQKNVDKTVEILSNAEEAAEDTVSKGFFRAQKIKLAFKSSKDVEGTRDAYKVAGDEYADSRSIWTEWLLFEIAQSTADSDSVKIVWDALSASTLAPETKALLGRKYADFLLEQGAPVADLINVDVQISFVSREIEVPSVAGGASNSPPRKRAMDTGAFSASKQARLEGDLSSQTSVNA